MGHRHIKERDINDYSPVSSKTDNSDSQLPNFLYNMTELPTDLHNKSALNSSLNHYSNYTDSPYSSIMKQATSPGHKSISMNVNSPNPKKKNSNNNLKNSNSSSNINQLLHGNTSPGVPVHSMRKKPNKDFKKRLTLDTSLDAHSSPPSSIPVKINKANNTNSNPHSNSNSISHGSSHGGSSISSSSSSMMPDSKQRLQGQSVRRYSSDSSVVFQEVYDEHRRRSRSRSASGEKGYQFNDRRRMSSDSATGSISSSSNSTSRRMSSVDYFRPSTTGTEIGRISEVSEGQNEDYSQLQQQQYREHRISSAPSVSPTVYSRTGSTGTALTTPGGSSDSSSVFGSGRHRARSKSKRTTFLFAASPLTKILMDSPAKRQRSQRVTKEPQGNDSTDRSLKDSSTSDTSVSSKDSEPPMKSLDPYKAQSQSQSQVQPPPQQQQQPKQHLQPQISDHRLSQISQLSQLSQFSQRSNLDQLTPSQRASRDLDQLQPLQKLAVPMSASSSSNNSNINQPYDQ
ncbi:unnamed protein product [Ambrosiozyma monospora]|uniref:Unnamed protein product n=1 Tax=Ambrosiozyma monospora TaxID=43982 RepID=A0ACB5T4B6_AMBMO|nr:unnamed protein product [Ambrosiozyma monospora]